MINQLRQRFSRNKQIGFMEISPGFPVIQVNNKHAQASISLYGGQLLGFQPNRHPEPVIWLSEQAIYQTGKAIRGGIPICWPWFAANSLHPEQPAHGFARIAFWEVEAIDKLGDGGTQIDLNMLCQSDCQHYQTIADGFQAQLKVRFMIGERLQVELTTTNLSDDTITIGEALHSYFHVSDISQVSIQGLDNSHYLDKLLGNQLGEQTGALQITRETDRIFHNTDQDIHLLDHGFNREILIAKQHSLTTVIWNPWQKNAQAMNDMSDNGWRSMVCIESANVDKNCVSIKPGQTHQMSTVIEVKPLN